MRRKIKMSDCPETIWPADTWKTRQVDIRKLNYSISNTSSDRKPLRRILMNDRPLASNFPRGPFPSVYNFDLRPFLSVLCMSGYIWGGIVVEKYFFINVIPWKKCPNKIYMKRCKVSSIKFWISKKIKSIGFFLVFFFLKEHAKYMMHL